MKKLILFALTASVIACGGSKQEQPAKAAASPHEGAQVQQAANKQIRGTVAETLDAKGFTYARLVTDSGDEWVVLPTTPLNAGQKLEVTGQMVSEKFTSKSLGRTFERVTFVEIEGQPPAHAEAAVQAEPETAVAETKSAGAAKPQTTGARSVSEVLAARATLGDQTVVVRGKVAKSLSGIMGKNWIHLREGSDDLTLTPAEVVKVGEVVTLEGVVRLDKDFGSGYKYAMIVEDARVVR